MKVKTRLLLSILVACMALLGTATAQEHKIGVSKFVPASYPPIARTARIQGEVKLQLRVASDGKVEKITVLNGHPILNQAAIEAVKQWRFLCIDCAYGAEFSHIMAVIYKLNDDLGGEVRYRYDFPNSVEIATGPLIISDPGAQLKRRWLKSLFRRQ